MRETCEKCGRSLWTADGDYVKRTPWKHDGKMYCSDRCTFAAITGTDWLRQAERNQDKWGEQRPANFVLAISEEVAEIAEEILENDAKQSQVDIDGYAMLYEVMNAGFAARGYLEETHEDSDGDALPPDQRPKIVEEIGNVEDVKDELHDLAPMMFQLLEILQEMESDTTE